MDFLPAFSPQSFWPKIWTCQYINLETWGTELPAGNELILSSIFQPRNLGYTASGLKYELFSIYYEIWTFFPFKIKDEFLIDFLFVKLDAYSRSWSSIRSSVALMAISVSPEVKPEILEQKLRREGPSGGIPEDGAFFRHNCLGHTWLSVSWELRKIRLTLQNARFL